MTSSKRNKDICWFCWGRNFPEAGIVTSYQGICIKCGSLINKYGENQTICGLINIYLSGTYVDCMSAVEFIEKAGG